jgi:penicillin-binding protein 1A
MAAVWCVILLLGVVAWFAWDLPDIEKAAALDRKPSITLLSANGGYLTSFGEIYGTPVTVSELPPHLPLAVLATEDRRYYDHGGIDILGLIRAVFVNVASGELRQGGSTITQQLAKNLFLTPERTLSRKIREVMLALWLEHRFTKNEILALYLNRVYFGAGAYGVDAAARRYFGKPATQVTVWESALLAGLLRAPSRLAPTNNPDLAGQRARLVLDLMVETGAIDRAAADAAGRNKVPAPPEGGSGIGGRYFADWILDQVQAHVGQIDRDLAVTTTLDPRLQDAANTIVQAGLASTKPGMPEQAALVAMTPNGAIRAMIGGKDYAQSQFNRATQAQRQPGSAFKLFVYLAALESGMTPDDRVNDSPVSIGVWSPDNFNDRYYGEVTLREAVARSLNSVAVRTTERVGAARVGSVAQRLGINSQLRPDLSLALGTSEVNLLELTGAFAALANAGNGVWPYGITEIRDRSGAVLYKRSAAAGTPVVEPGIVADMNDLLGAVLEWGTGRAASLGGRPAAGKTGTSQDHRDAWLVGYTADLVAGVWVGNDDNSPMKNVTGGSIPAKLWRDFMVKAHAGLPAKPLPPSNAARPPRDSAPSRPVAQAPAPRERSIIPRSWFGGSEPQRSGRADPVAQERQLFEKMGQ